MKKILSTIVAALVAVSFAAVVFAEDSSYSERRDAAPSGEMRRDEPRRDEVKPMEQHKKLKKHHRQTKHKKQIRKEEQHQK
jgi:Ni/Co efflux regulator RcnB